MTDHDADTDEPTVYGTETDHESGDEPDATQDAAGDEEPAEVPPAVVDEAERLTRLAREAVDENEATAYREEREALVAEHGFSARVREDGSRDTLVLYPDEWTEDGLIRRDRIEDVDRGIERPLDAPGAEDDWEEVESRNRAIADRVAAEHGAPHGANVSAFADFMSNHHARAIDDATDADVEEFLTEYYPRNAWPTDRQRDAVEESVALALETADAIAPD